jgi:hypothetical protein
MFRLIAAFVMVQVGLIITRADAPQPTPPPEDLVRQASYVFTGTVLWQQSELEGKDTELAETESSAPSADRAAAKAFGRVGCDGSELAKAYTADAERH